MTIDLVFERILTTSHGFKVGGIFTSFKTGLYRRIEKTCVSLERKESKFEGVCTTLFPYENRVS
jgi:hypothetical protein